MPGATADLAAFDRANIAIDSNEWPSQNQVVTVPAIPSDAARFRMAILPPLIFISIGALVLGFALGTVILAKHHYHLNWVIASKIILFSIPLLLLYALVFTLAISFLFPSFICATGIYGHSFLGGRQHLGWAEIIRVKKVCLGNLVYLRLYGKEGRGVMWFPLFQSPPAAFRNEIRRFAPPGHPILGHLE